MEREELEPLMRRLMLLVADFSPKMMDFSSRLLQLEARDSSSPGLAAQLEGRLQALEPLVLAELRPRLQVLDRLVQDIWPRVEDLEPRVRELESPKPRLEPRLRDLDERVRELESRSRALSLGRAALEPWAREPHSGPCGQEHIGRLECRVRELEARLEGAEPDQSRSPDFSRSARRRSQPGESGGSVGARASHHHASRAGASFSKQLNQTLSRLEQADRNVGKWTGPPESRDNSPDSQLSGKDAVDQSCSPSLGRRSCELAGEDSGQASPVPADFADRLAQRFESWCAGTESELRHRCDATARATLAGLLDVVGCDATAQPEDGSAPRGLERDLGRRFERWCESTELRLQQRVLASTRDILLGLAESPAGEGAESSGPCKLALGARKLEDGTQLQGLAESTKLEGGRARAAPADLESTLLHLDRIGRIDPGPGEPRGTGGPRPWGTGRVPPPVEPWSARSKLLRSMLADPLHVQARSEGTQAEAQLALSSSSC